MQTLAYDNSITVTTAGVHPVGGATGVLYTRRSVGGISASAEAGDDVYDALNPKGRRRVASNRSTKAEDLLLTQAKRERMDANALDVQRNMSLLGWMIRRTLDYCCLWDYYPTNDDDGLNNELRAKMAIDCEAENNDYVGRMSWDDMRRVSESLKITTGDCFPIPLREGTLQLVEGSTCKSPRTIATGDRWINGAKLNNRGRVVQWNFREIDLADSSFGNSYRDRQVSAQNVWQHVQYEGRANVIRGVSPIASALNELRDIYETMDLARAKIKLEQLFGIAIFRHPDDDDDIAPAVQTDGEADDNDPTTVEESYDFGNGPVVMDRTVGEEVKLLQANSPGNNTQDFLKLCIQLVLLGLDIPANFWNPSETNFFGSRAAWNLFERACHARRSTQLRLHKRMTNWRHARWTTATQFGGSGEIKLPGRMQFTDLKYRWIPRGVPWWKPQEELNVGLARVASGLATMQGLCDEAGLGLYTENLKTIAREKESAAALGFDLIFNTARLDVTLQARGSSNTKPTKGGAA